MSIFYLHKEKIPNTATKQMIILKSNLILFACVTKSLLSISLKDSTHTTYRHCFQNWNRETTAQLPRHKRMKIIIHWNVV